MPDEINSAEFLSAIREISENLHAIHISIRTLTDKIDQSTDTMHIDLNEIKKPLQSIRNAMPED